MLRPMEYGISHDREEESLEAKARWFWQKPLEDRLREALESVVFVNQWCQVEIPDDRSTYTTVQILELPRG